MNHEHDAPESSEERPFSSLDTAALDLASAVLIINVSGDK